MTRYVITEGAETFDEMVALTRAAGVDPHSLIMTRAFAIRLHAAAGEVAEAEALADQIDALQLAYSDWVSIPRLPAPRGYETWHLTAERWAEFMVGGASRIEREFHAPIGCSAERAADSARGHFYRRRPPIFAGQHITAADVRRAEAPAALAAE